MKLLSILCLLFTSSFVYADEYEEIARCVAITDYSEAKFYMGIALNGSEDRVIMNVTLVGGEAVTEDGEDEIKPQNQFQTVVNTGSASISEDGKITINMDGNDEDEAVIFQLYNIEGDSHKFTIPTEDDVVTIECITV